MRSPWIRALVGGVISVVCVALVLRGVRLDEVWRALAATDPVAIGATILVMLLTTVVRTWRWQTLIAGLGRAPYLPTFSSLMVGYLVNNIVPLRTGELVRVYLLNRATSLSRGGLLATVALERTLDGLFLVGCLAVLVRLLPFPDWAYRAGLLAGLVFLGVALALGLASSRRVGVLVRSQVLARLPARPGTAATQLWDRVSEGVRALRRPDRAALVLAQTGCVWLLEFATAYLALVALRLQVPVAAAVLLTVAVGLGGIVPSGPSAVGTYEFLVVSSLAVFAVASGPALALAALLHGLTFLMTNTIGLLALAAGWTFSGGAASRPWAALSQTLRGGGLASPAPSPQEPNG